MMRPDSSPRISRTCRGLILALSFLVSSPAAAEKVVRVIDGDTVELSSGVTIRYIGVDSPETTVQGEVERLLARQALAYNALLVQDKEVRLEYDLERTDRYGRTLAYLYVGSVFVNEEMVRMGWAKVMTIAPNVRYAETFKVDEAEAMRAHAGLWAVSQPEPLKATAKATGTEKVYVTASGTKYHRDGCRYLSKSAIPIARDDAVSQGYQPCSVCGGGTATKATPTYVSPPSTTSGGHCQAITKKGTQCKRNAAAGSKYCWQHGG
jgi:micrococcal nuclease